jgi:AcrR family transcriptional regulator
MPNQVDSKSACRTKQLFKVALMRLLETESFAYISVKDIVETANYNRTTFYNHYYDKFDLLDDVTKDLLEGMAVAVKNSFEHFHQTHRMSMKASEVTLFDYIYNHRNIIYICKSTSIEKNITQICAQTIYDALVEVWTPLVNMSEQQLASYTKIFTNTVVGTIHCWIDEKFESPPEQVRSEFVDFYNHAL